MGKKFNWYEACQQAKKLLREQIPTPRIERTTDLYGGRDATERAKMCFEENKLKTLNK